MNYNRQLASASEGRLRPQAAPGASKHARLVFTIACLAMLVFGIVLTTLGSILPDVIGRFGVDKTTAGALLLSLTFGVLLGSLLFGPVVDRAGYKLPLALAAALVAVGLEFIALGGSLDWLRAGVLLIGVGGGVLNGGASTLVADISSDHKAAGLSLLGVFFGVGAVGVPFALGALSGRMSYSALLSATGGIAGILLLFALFVRFPEPKQAQAFPLRQATRLVREPTLLLLGGILFLQSGMEITVGGWSSTFAREELALSARASLYFLSLYWLGMMLARLALGSLLRRVSPARALIVSLTLAFVGSLFVLNANSLATGAVGIFLTGAGFAGVFPIVLGWVGERYAALSGTAFSVAFVMALSGGMLLPYVTGALGNSFGMRTSLLIVPIALILSTTILTILKSKRLLVVQA